VCFNNIRSIFSCFNIIYSSKEPEWTKFNAPYFNEFKFLDITYLYDVVDPNFPNHHPDPTIKANLEDLRKKVLEVGGQAAGRVQASVLTIAQ